MQETTQQGEHPDVSWDAELQDEVAYLVETSYAQQRLWVMEQIEDGAPTYNISIGLRLRGTLDEDALRRTLAEVIRRHEILRTRLVVEDDQLSQLISAAVIVPLITTDVSDRSDPERAWSSVAETALRRPFDAARDLPIRTDLVRLGDREHVLLITLDHVVCDAWSLRVLHDEIVTIYPAFAAGRSAPLPELPVQYADYATWQREWLAGPERHRQLEYWRGRLGEAPPRLHLQPTGDYAGPGGNRSWSVPIPDDLVDVLAEFARHAGASLFSAMLCGFGALLARHSRQDEFVVGSLLAGRGQPELEDLIGFFVNTVGLRLDLTGRPTFRESLRRVHDTALDAYAHQDIPFQQVAEELDPAHRAGAGQPFFDVMFQLADLTRAPADTGDLRLEPIPMASEPAPVDLVVAVLKEAAGWQAVFDYRVGLFDPDTVRRLQEQWFHLLRAAVADPDRPLDELPLAGPAERNLVTRQWNATDPEADETWVFGDHLTRTAATRGDALALAGPGERYSYAELDARVNRLARLLRGHGVGPETLVGICLERGVPQVTAILGVLKAGGGYLPLDPDYPADRLAYMLGDAAPAMVITSDGIRDRLPADAAPVILEIDACLAQLGELPATRPAVAVLPDNLAYLIYTSGSTGRPKGTEVSQRGMRIVIDALDEVLGLTGADRVLHFASASFDASVLEMLMAFGAGAALYVAPPGPEALSRIADILREEEITTVMLPPSVMSAVVGDEPLPKLRTITVGGEACPPALAARWAPGRTFVNLYGPTEATIVSTYHRVPAAQSGPVPIGRPMPGVPVYLLDERLEPVPVGVPGELYVGGQVLARGYRGRPGLTADRFVPDPLGDTPGRRLYRTGDLCRWAPEGTLQFLGRLDHQVKLRGFRIELAEIEAVLGSCPQVREAVAVLREDNPGSKEIVGYVAADGNVGEDDLRAACGQRLPHFMVPSHVVVLDRLPVAPGGKIDRTALPAPARPEQPTAADAGGSPLEVAIGELWGEILNVHGVGPADDFFDLGGDSLTATRLVNRLRNELQLDLPIRTLFDHPVLAEFSVAVRSVAMASQ